MANAIPVATLNVRARAAVTVSELVARIKSNIEKGVWGPGTRLPTERELEKTLGVSRNTLRRSLKALEGEGKIVRQVGRGSFVAGAAASYTTGESDSGRVAEQQELLKRIRGASPADVMEMRLILEPSIAEFAAHRATGADLLHMEECLARGEAARSVREFEKWDGALHMALVAAARNTLLIDVCNAMNEVRSQPAWQSLKMRSLTPERRALYQQQHRAVVRALKDHDPESARAAILRHLQTVRANLLGSP